MTTQAAATLSFSDPHTLIFSIAAMLCLVPTFIPWGDGRSLSWQRKVYWSSTFGAATCAFIASLPSVFTGILLAAFAIFLMALPAYFSTQYIKIGRWVIAFRSATDLTAGRTDSGEPLGDEPYSSKVSAAKMWWLMVFGVGIGAANLLIYVVDREDLRYGLLGLGIIVAVGALFGFGDASSAQRVARGQYVPFTVIVLMTVGIFGLCYLAAYAATLRWKQTPR